MDGLDTQSLGLGGNYYSVIQVLEQDLEKHQLPSNEALAMIMDTSANGAEGMLRTRSIKPIEEPQPSYGGDQRLGIVKLLKKEFHDFLCTKSKHYQKERMQIGGNINLLIVGLASAIAVKFVSLEAGVITSFVTVFFKILAKMGKRVICESFGISTKSAKS